MVEERFYYCPYCFSEVSILIDCSIESQEYIEDCERCCNPINFEIKVKGTVVTYFSAEPIGQ